VAAVTQLNQPVVDQEVSRVVPLSAEEAQAQSVRLEQALAEATSTSNQAISRLDEQ